MRLLVEKIDSTELLRLKSIFEEKGIPVFVGGSKTPGLWICLDSQFEDAKALVSNPAHEVSNPVNVEEYYQILKERQTDQIASMGIDSNKILNYLFTTIALGILIYIATKFI